MARGWFALTLAVAGTLTACSQIRGNSGASQAASDGGVLPGSDESGRRSDAADDPDAPAATAGQDASTSEPRAPEANAGNAAASGGGPGGVAGSAGGAAGPAANGGGAPAEAPMTTSTEVRGRVIDHWKQPIEAVSVTIDGTTVTTDASGAFSIPAAGARYDALLKLPPPFVGGTPVDRLWMFQAVTRRDPTFQVYSGRPERSAPLTIQVTGVNFATSVSPDEVVWSSFAGADGDFAQQLTSATTEQRATWYGGSMTRLTAHAIWLRREPGTETTREFVAYAEDTLDLTSDQPAEVSLDLAANTLPTTSVSGSVDGAAAPDFALSVYLDFSDGAALQATTERSGERAFTRTVPIVPGAAYRLLAAQGDGSAYQRVHALVSPGGAGPTLTMPVATDLLSPGNGQADVDGETVFEWSSTGRLYLLTAYSEDFYTGLFVVTTETQARLPVRPTTMYALPAGQQFSWYLETHGDYASVDAATGPDGFIDYFASFPPHGPGRAKGSYTETSARMFDSRR